MPSLWNHRIVMNIFQPQNRHKHKSTLAWACKTLSYKAKRKTESKFMGKNNKQSSEFQFQKKEILMIIKNANKSILAESCRPLLVCFLLYNFWIFPFLFLLFIVFLTLKALNFLELSSCHPLENDMNYPL